MRQRAFSNSSKKWRYCKIGECMNKEIPSAMLWYVLFSHGANLLVWYEYGANNKVKTIHACPQFF